METRVCLWTIALCALVSYWFYANSRLQIDYERHIQLVDPDTGAKHKPSELLDLAKIIQPSPEYINSTNAVERLYDLAYLSTFENPFAIDQSYSSKQDLLVSGWPVANQTRCTSQLDWILEQLNWHARGDYSSLRGRLGYDLTRFMDSFGRPESGLFSGSIHWLGSYKNCLAAKLDDGRIKTRYCMVKMRFKSWPQKENIYPATRIRVGVCLPETCDTLSYESSKEQIDRLAMLEMSPRYKDKLESDAMFCLPDERSPLREIPAGGRIFIAIVGAWLAIVLTATVLYESKIRPRELAYARTRSNFVSFEESKPQLGPETCSISIGKQSSSSSHDEMLRKGRILLEQIIRNISIRSSIKAFKTNTFRVHYNRGERVRLNLGCLDFFKVIMTLLVVLAHAGYLTSTHMRSMGSRIELNTGELGLMGMTVARCVDTFFLFFGVLTSYNLLKKFNESQLSNPLTWLAVNVGIFIRIAPLFMLVYWYAKLISPYTGSGPWWDYGIDSTSIRGTCLQEPWWKSIPYLGSSGHTGVPACNLPSWFIVSYSQLSLLMPLITYLIYKLPWGQFTRCALVCLLLTASAGSIALRLAQQTTIREEGITLYGLFLADLLEKFESTGHLTTLGRLGAVAIGCLVGYLMRRYEEKQITGWPRWVTSKTANFTCLLGLVAMVFLPVIGHRVYLFTGRMATWSEFIGTNVLLIIMWPIIVAILVISWTTRYNHLVWVRFLSHSFWHVFNRLGLCIFLIHWEVLHMVITGFEQAPSYGFMFDIMKLWAFGVFFSLIFALLIHILFEAPISNLMMIFHRYLMSMLSSEVSATMMKQAEEK